jgi:hypothetical protein
MLDKDYSNGHFIGFYTYKQGNDVTVLFLNDRHSILIMPSNGSYWSTASGFLDVSRYIDEFIEHILHLYGDYVSIEASIWR